MDKNCKIHYSGYDNYSKKSISLQNESRIKAAKLKGETTKGDNHHKNQCKSVPDTINNDIHGVHSTLCKKFTLILAGDDNESQGNSSRGSQWQPGTSKAAWVYPNVCKICNKGRITYQRIKVYPKPLTTYDAF